MVHTSPQVQDDLSGIFGWPSWRTCGGILNARNMTFTIIGSNVEYASSVGAGLKFVCFQEPRFTALRPIVGPSWQGSAVTLVTTLMVRMLTTRTTTTTRRRRR